MKKEKIYELGFWIRISVDPDKELEKIINLLEKSGCEIVEKNPPRKRELAYPIEKETIGYFGFILFKSSPDIIQNLKEELRFHKNILRFIIIKTKIKPKEELSKIKVNES